MKEDSKETGNYMNGFEKQVIESLSKLETLITEDHRLLRGNGHPGLVDRVAAVEASLNTVNEFNKFLAGFKDFLGSLVSLKADVEILKQKRSWWHTLLVDGLAVACMLISFYCAFLK